MRQDSATACLRPRALGRPDVTAGFDLRLLPPILLGTSMSSHSISHVVAATPTPLTRVEIN